MTLSQYRSKWMRRYDRVDRSGKPHIFMYGGRWYRLSGRRFNGRLTTLDNFPRP